MVGRNRGWRGQRAGVEGTGSGDRGGGESGKIGAGNYYFFFRKFTENGSYRPINYIKVHQGKHAYLRGLFCHTTHVMYGASRISACFFTVVQRIEPAEKTRLSG